MVVGGGGGIDGSTMINMLFASSYTFVPPEHTGCPNMPTKSPTWRRNFLCSGVCRPTVGAPGGNRGMVVDVLSVKSPLCKRPVVVLADMVAASSVKLQPTILRAFCVLPLKACSCLRLRPQACGIWGLGCHRSQPGVQAAWGLGSSF